MIFSLPKAEEILVHSHETRNLLFSGMIDTPYFFVLYN